MTSFLGEYECRLDAKSRFLLPAGLRKQIDPVAKEEFVMNRGFEGCLVLYPVNEWEKITSRMRKLNLFTEKARRFFRQFHNGATSISLDSNGRVLVPKTLIKYGELKKDVVLFAYANRIEVWAKDEYEAEMAEHTDDFAALAEDVMGGLNEEGDAD